MGTLSLILEPELNHIGNVPVALTLMAPTFFGNDASGGWQNSFISGLENLDREISFIVAPVNEINYGITSNVPWFEIKGKRYRQGKDRLPRYCICRCNEDDAIYHIRSMGIPCFPDPDTVQFFESKRRMTAFVSSLGVPCIDGVFGNYEKSPEELEYPLIVKPANGFAGSNVRKVIDDVTRHCAEYEVNRSEPGGIMWQAAMATGDDLRIYMLGTTPYCGIFRKATMMKANLMFSPEITYMTADQLEKRYPDAFSYAKTIACAIKGEAGLYSIDFLFDDSDGQRKAIFGEVSVGNLGTRLLRENRPGYVADYVQYIEEHL